MKKTYLRLSITSRCNLHCAYCRPEGSPPREEDELAPRTAASIARAARRCGVEVCRLTGGEPTLHRRFERMCEVLRQTWPEADLRLTTNGTTLRSKADFIHSMGFSSINVSLDSLAPDRFEAVTGSRSVHRVVEGIERALELGIRVKINVLAFEGVLDELDEFAALASELGIPVRFIEYMRISAATPPPERPLEEAELLAALERSWGPSRPVEVDGTGPRGPAFYRLFANGVRAGFITPVSRSFCAGCNRIRITSGLRLKTCLFEFPGLDLRGVLEREDAEEILAGLLHRAMVGGLEHRSGEGRAVARRFAEEPPEEPMYAIGG